MADANTDSILVITDRIFDILDANKASLTYGGKTVQDVWFDDQDLLPKTPAICVVPNVKRRPISGASNFTENRIDTIILVYHVSVTPDMSRQDTKRTTIGLAEVIEAYLHNNQLQLLTTGGDRLTIHSWVTEMDPGYAYKNGTLYNAVQMNWSSLTKTRLKTI